MKASIRVNIILLTIVFVTAVLPFFILSKAVAEDLPFTRVPLSEINVPEYTCDGEWLEMKDSVSGHKLPFLWCYRGGKNLIFEQEGPRVFLSIDGEPAKLTGVIIRSREEVKILAEELAKNDELLTVWIYGPKLAALNDLVDTSEVSSIQIWEYNYGLISDLSPLERLSNVISLCIRDCDNIKDLTPVAKLTKLTSFDGQGCFKFENISALGKLSELQCLNIENHVINDYKPLMPLRTLRCLKLESDFKDPEGCKYFIFQQSNLEKL